MMWLGIVPAVFLIIILYLIFASFYLEIDSSKELLQFRYSRIASLRVKIINSSLILDLKILGWQKRIDPFKTTKKVSKPAKPKTKKKKRNIPFKKIIAVIKSFRINKCSLNIDSGDVALNGMIYPVFWGFSNISNQDFRINFTNQTELKLEVENKLGRIMWAYLIAK